MLAGLSELPDLGHDRDRLRRGRRSPSAPSWAPAATFDLALDPLEGRGVVARGGTGAMSMLAVGRPGSLMRLPDMYMRRMAVGPRARGGST